MQLQGFTIIKKKYAIRNKESYFLYYDNKEYETKSLVGNIITATRSNRSS